jgi:hypothetical protein
MNTLKKLTISLLSTSSIFAADSAFDTTNLLDAPGLGYRKMAGKEISTLSIIKTNEVPTVDLQTLPIFFSPAEEIPFEKRFKIMDSMFLPSPK